MRSITILVLITLAVFLTGCPEDDLDADSTITLINNSEFDIIHVDERRIIGDTLLQGLRYMPYPDNPNDLITANSRKDLNGPFIYLLRKAPNEVY